MVENQSEINTVNINEEDLIKRAKIDPRAFEALYLHFVKPVYRYLYSRIGSQHEAEDATAQTFLDALTGLKNYRHEGYFGAWLFSIARRKAADHFRLSSRSQFLPDDLPSFDTDLLEQTLNKERIVNLRELIQKLNEEEQELLRLRYAAQLGFAEIARLLGRTEEAVKKNLYRLQDRLQSQLEKTDD